MLCEAGAIKACVFALENGDVRTTPHVGILRSVLFGSDGREGFNSSAAAAARREHAAAVGAIGKTLIYFAQWAFQSAVANDSCSVE